MSLFSWKKVPVQTLADVTLSDEKKAKIDAVVASWGDVKRAGRAAVVDSGQPPLQLLSAEEVAYFVQALEEEAARIDAEATELSNRRLAEIAEKDAQIASLNREIVARKASIEAQQAEIDKRAEMRAKLIEIAKKIEPSLDASAIVKDAHIRSEVVRRRFGDEAVRGRSEAYIDDRFDALVAQVNVDPFARVMRDGVIQKNDPRRAAEEAWQKSVEDLSNAWKH